MRLAEDWMMFWDEKVLGLGSFSFFGQLLATRILLGSLIKV